MKRREFWGSLYCRSIFCNCNIETRVEGLPDMWQALRGACESSESIIFKFTCKLMSLVNDSMAIINAAGLKLVSKSLQMAYDAQGKSYKILFFSISEGYKYDVPIFCINPPTSYELKSETKVDKQNMKINTVNVNNSLKLNLSNLLLIR